MCFPPWFNRLPITAIMKQQNQAYNAKKVLIKIGGLESFAEALGFQKYFSPHADFRKSPANGHQSTASSMMRLNYCISLPHGTI